MRHTGSLAARRIIPRGRGSATCAWLLSHEPCPYSPRRDRTRAGDADLQIARRRETALRGPRLGGGLRCSSCTAGAVVVIDARLAPARPAARRARARRLRPDAAPRRTRRDAEHHPPRRCACRLAAAPPAAALHLLCIDATGRHAAESLREVLPRPSSPRWWARATWLSSRFRTRPTRCCAASSSRTERSPPPRTAPAPDVEYVWEAWKRA